MTAFQAELEATGRDAHPSDHSAYRGHRQALEMYAFALQWFIEVAEKTRKTGEAAETGGAKKVRPGRCWPYIRPAQQAS
jgi:condensin complex subunit 1